MTTSFISEQAPVFTAVERLPLSECQTRIARCRRLLAGRHPEAQGLLLCSRVQIYYLTGTLGAGLVWLPLDGEPVLMLRKGCARARLESPLTHILPFRSYREVADLCRDAGSPLGTVIAVDKNAFSWTMADMIAKRLPGVRFVGGDDVMARARAVKTPWERFRMRECGRVHADIMDHLLPALMHPGMREDHIAAAYARLCLESDCDGMCRMNAHGEEMFYGYASCQDNGLYPTAYNGPLGCRGLHPATPFIGSRDVVWKERSLCAVDMGCQKRGYHTDRTQCYWSGPERTLPEPLARAHAVCVDIINQSLAKVRPGTTPAELWADAKQTADAAGVSLGFMGHGPDQVPFLGHGIGLMLDEWPALARTFDEPLEEGMAIALEPKVAVPGLGMTGVEHTYLVGADGPEPLTGTRTGIIFIS